MRTRCHPPEGSNDALIRDFGAEVMSYGNDMRLGHIRFTVIDIDAPPESGLNYLVPNDKGYA